MLRRGKKNGFFYVYEHWRPDINEPFYVGKGKGKRAYATHVNSYHRNIVSSLRRRGLRYRVVFVKVDLSERDAFDFEVQRIAFWRRWGINLANCTDGGEGSSNPSLFVREAVAASNRRRVFTAEKKARMSEVLRGRKLSLDVIAKRRGRKHTLETRVRMSAAALRRKPRVFSAAARANIAAGHRGLKRSREAIEKAARARRGYRHSLETRAKLVAAWKRRKIIYSVQPRENGRFVSGLSK